MVLVAGLFLAACTEKIEDTISKIKGLTTTACHFVPTATSLIVLINASAGATAQVLADKICSAVALLPANAPAVALLDTAKPAEIVVVVDGVVITGEMTQ
jgi:hypothetical protein